MIHTAGENEEEFDVATLASTYVTISGEDTVGDAPQEESQETETGEENPVSDIPTVMEVPVEEQTYYLVDLSQYTPENIDFQYDTGTITYQGTEVAAYLSANGDISFVYLADSQKNLTRTLTAVKKINCIPAIPSQSTEKILLHVSVCVQRVAAGTDT